MESSTRSARAAGLMGALFLMLMAGCGYAGTGPYGGGGGDGGVTSGRTLTIAMHGQAFGPELDTVTVGSTVTWTNQDGFEHTTTSDAGLWESGVVVSGQSFQHTFTDTGAYPYHCRIHGASGGVGMAGTVVVVP